MKKTTASLVFSLLSCAMATTAQTIDHETKVLIPTASWGQSSPYNSQLPTINGQPVQAGCVPVACAIIMNHWQWPQNGVGETDPYMTWTTGIDMPSRDLTLEYQWPEVEPARLIADIGSALKTDYSVIESPTFTSENVLVKRFGYHPDMKRHRRKDYPDSLWHHMLHEELDKNRPVFYSAEHSDGGHAFVIDGYDSKGRYHINWGWSGSYNGWYTLDSLIAGFRFYDKSHTLLTGFIPHKELYAEVNKTNQDKHMQYMTLSYNKKTGLLSLTHPRYSFVTIKADGMDMHHLLTGWSEYTTIETAEYPEGLYEITVWTGPYTKTIIFQNLKR